MSRRKNILSVGANYSMLYSDGVIEASTAGIVIDLPPYDGTSFPVDDGKNLKDTKYFYFFARDTFDLNTLDTSIFNINGLTTYTVPSGVGLTAHYYLGKWFLNFFDITASGGGITDLTGDVTGTGPGSTATTIANDAVSFAKMQNIATDSLIGRDTAGTGDPENITLNATLSMSAGTLQRAALTGDVTAPAGSNATTIANNAVTTAKMVQLSAYKFWGNDTNAAANAAEHDFQDEGETAITATITHTGTTAPSGASTLSQWFVRIGNTVFYKFMLTYATAGTATTQVTIAFPSEFPAAFEPTALTAASAFLYMMDYSRALTTPNGTMTSNANAALRRNAGDTANEFVFTHSSGNYRTWHMGGSYRCT